MKKEIFIANLLRKVYRINVYDPQEVLHTLFKQVSMYHKEDLDKINGFIIDDMRINLDTINKDFMNEFSVTVDNYKIDYKETGIYETGKNFSIQIKGDNLPHNAYKERFEKQVKDVYRGITTKGKMFNISDLDRTKLYLIYVPKGKDLRHFRPTHPKQETQTIEGMYKFVQDELTKDYGTKNFIRKGAYGLYLRKYVESDLAYCFLKGNPSNIKVTQMPLREHNTEVPCFIMYDAHYNRYFIYTVTHMFLFTQNEEPKVYDFYEENLENIADKLNRLITCNLNNGNRAFEENYGFNYKNIYTKSKPVLRYSQNN